MKDFSSYLVCKEHVEDVKKFLAQFFDEIVYKYTHSDWVRFEIPNTNFTVHLMKGDDQDITKNMTFEIGCESLKELEDYAQKYNCKIKSFPCNEAEQKYIYNYIVISGPANICKMEISFAEDINT